MRVYLLVSGLRFQVSVKTGLEIQVATKDVNIWFIMRIEDSGKFNFGLKKRMQYEIVFMDGLESSKNKASIMWKRLLLASRFNGASREEVLPGDENRGWKAAPTNKSADLTLI